MPRAAAETNPSPESPPLAPRAGVGVDRAPDQEPALTDSAGNLKPGALFQRLGPASALAIGACVLPPLGSLLLFWRMNDAGNWIRAHGWEGAAVYTLAFALAAGLAFLPTYAASILGGWALGFALGFPAALVGFTGGALIGFGVARLAARERVERILAAQPRWRAVRDALVRGGFLRSTAIITLVRLPPTSPFAIGNLVMASVKAPLGPFIIGTILGMAPRTAAVVWVATLLRQKLGDSADAQAIAKAGGQVFDSWWYIGIGIVGAFAVVLILSHIARRTLARMTDSPVR
ncbi:hypothetical protein BH11PLA1_BH11PLA1_13810 [soil metagenome]